MTLISLFISCLFIERISSRTLPMLFTLFDTALQGTKPHCHPTKQGEDSIQEQESLLLATNATKFQLRISSSSCFFHPSKLTIFKQKTNTTFTLLCETSSDGLANTDPQQKQEPFMSLHSPTTGCFQHNTHTTYATLTFKQPRTNRTQV